MNYIKYKFNKICFLKPDDPSPWGRRPKGTDEKRKETGKKCYDENEESNVMKDSVLPPLPLFEPPE
ncbi:hypothetical protein ACFL0U_03390 [Pseudomonadota bacterium]